MARTRIKRDSERDIKHYLKQKDDDQRAAQRLEAHWRQREKVYEKLRKA